MTLTPEMVEIEPCPFCGSVDISDGEVLTEHPSGKVTTQSMCNGCGALGPEADTGNVPDYGSVKARAAWNRRTESRRAVEDDEFNEGDRVTWTNSHGTPFPATIYAKGIGYHLHLDDGTEITTTGKLRALIDRAGGGDVRARK